MWTESVSACRSKIQIKVVAVMVTAIPNLNSIIVLSVESYNHCHVLLLSLSSGVRNAPTYGSYKYFFHGLVSLHLETSQLNVM